MQKKQNTPQAMLREFLYVDLGDKIVGIRLLNGDKPEHFYTALPEAENHEFGISYFNRAALPYEQDGVTKFQHLDFMRVEISQPKIFRQKVSQAKIVGVLELFGHGEMLDTGVKSSRTYLFSERKYAQLLQVALEYNCFYLEQRRYVALSSEAQSKKYPCQAHEKDDIAMLNEHSTALLKSATVKLIEGQIAGPDCITDALRMRMSAENHRPITGVKLTFKNAAEARGFCHYVRLNAEGVKPEPQGKSVLLGVQHVWPLRSFLPGVDDLNPGKNDLRQLYFEALEPSGRGSGKAT